MPLTSCYKCNEQYPESEFIWEKTWGKICKRCYKSIHWGIQIIEWVEKRNKRHNVVN